MEGWFTVPKGVSAVNLSMAGGGGGGATYGAGGGGAANHMTVTLPPHPSPRGPIAIMPAHTPSYPDEMQCYLALLDVRYSRAWRKLPQPVRNTIKRVLKGE